MARRRVTTCISLLISGMSAAAQHASGAPDESARVKQFLRSYLKDHEAVDVTTRYFAKSVDLTGDGRKEVVVYFTDQHSCGTGGCTTLILVPAGASYKVITSLTIGWPPIRVLRSMTNGWHDLGVWVQGGGIQPGYEAELPFNGRTYPRNPSVPPARHATEPQAGTIIVPKDVVGAPLY